MARILLVDDEQMVRMVYGMILELEGHKVVLASDGLCALHLFGEHNFDLVITDFNMPNMNGNELSKKIKELKSDVPIIMITSDFPEQRIADVIMAKPFSTKDLLENINLFLKK